MREQKEHAHLQYARAHPHTHTQTHGRSKHTRAQHTLARALNTHTLTYAKDEAASAKESVRARQLADIKRESERQLVRVTGAAETRAAVLEDQVCVCGYVCV